LARVEHQSTLFFGSSNIFASALDFDKLGGWLALAGHEAPHRFALRLHAKQLQALIVGRNPVISDEKPQSILPALCSNDRLNEYTRPETNRATTIK
jgi:hypothetical protein